MSPRAWGWNPLYQIEQALMALRQDMDSQFAAVQQKLTQIGVSMATQADIDALTTAVGTLVTNLTADDGQLQTAITGIAAEIAALQQANPALDVSALQTAVTNATAAVTQIGTDATNVAALVPPAVTPPAGG